MKSLHFARCSGRLVKTERTANKCSCGHVIQPKEYHVVTRVESLFGDRVWKKVHLCKTCIMKNMNSWIKDIQKFRDAVLRYTDPELYQESKNSLKKNPQKGR